MRRGDIVEGVVSRVEFPNRGIMEVEGERVITKNVLPGQTVSVRVLKKRSNHYEGNVLEVVKKADYEREDCCEHYPACGGCLYQSMPYDMQLELKRAQVKKLIDDAYPEEYTFGPIHPSPSSSAYRNKMEFSFGDLVKDGPLTLGLHKRATTYDVISVTNCQIVDEDFRTVLRTVLEFYENRDIAYYRKTTHEGFLRHLLVRKSAFTGQMLVALVTASGGMEYDELEKYLELDKLCGELTSKHYTGELTGFLHILNDSLADVVQSDRTTILYGTDVIEEKLLGLSFKITPFSFFQTNSRGAEVLYSVARDFIGDTANQTVFDLYSGTGTIAQIAASVAKKCIGVEIVEEAVVAARENARLNGITNCEFIAGDVLKVIDTIEEKPDMIILDPPRDGIHPKALPKIINYGVPNIVYISCKPSSLARDLVYFHAAGYRIRRIECVDMFPNTANVETVCLLQRMSNTRLKEITIDVEM